MATRRTLAIIIALALILGGIACLSGCSKRTKACEITEDEIEGLVEIFHEAYYIDGFYVDQVILYDPDTHVMYSIISNGQDLTMSVLYNADGTPKLYNPK